MKRVAAIFTGGTISMRVDPAAGGNVPALDGAGILAAAPGIERLASIDVTDMGRTPASHFTYPQLFDIAAAIRSAQSDPAVDGVVVVQGTDVLEETAFFWDLVLDGRTPVVVTGAMRSASEDGYDGPRNLRDAVVAASSTSLGGEGVLVCLAGSVHAADDVTKTLALDTFQSLNDGPVATIEDGELTILRRRIGRRHVATTTAAERVRLVTAHLGMDAAVIDALAAIGLDGLVVAATGSGNTTAGFLDAARRVMAGGTPVVLATRCGAGAAGTGYAFPGGGATWVRAGAMLPGTLSGPKARLALALGLGAGLDHASLAAMLAGPAGPA